MKRKITYILSILVLLNGISAFAWGPKGHDVVAAIAEQNLTKKAKKRISELLDGKSIVYYSCLLYTSPSPRDRQKSRMPSSA